jgi:gamma-glutamyltranspeptidase/glutathione hydrolase
MELGTTKRKARLGTSWIAIVAFILIVSVPAVGARSVEGARAVSSENALASREAMAILRQGGTAVDAAITAALVAGVASPSSSGIGGGGFAAIYDASEKHVTILDFRETAPAGIDASAFENRPLPDERRGVLAGVPGEVAGLFELHGRFGKLPWKKVVLPAERIARQGFELNAHGAMVLGFMGKALAVDPVLDALYLKAGEPRIAGARIRNLALAKTLGRIANEGPRAFYSGPIAADIAAAVQAHGGSLTVDDLARYTPIERKPLLLDWEGYAIHTMPPPSAGGLMLIQTLTMLRARELQKLVHGSGAYVHMLAEAARGAVADRVRYLGDPDHERIDFEMLLAPARMSRRRATLGLDRTHALPRFGLEEHGTHHLVTADSEGNVVSLTTTVNRPFGSRIAAKDSGIFLNDELNDFTAAADVKKFGMTASPNRARPGARPVSSMTPTIVTREGSPVLALGGSGGLTIATNVTQVTLARLAFGMEPAAILDAHRFSIPMDEGTISLGRGAPEALALDLARRGEIVKTSRFDAHAVQLIAIDGNVKMPAADPRKHGSALAE